MTSRFLLAVFACTLSALLATGCNSSSSDASGAYRYTFQENNDTPQDLSATLFEALRTDNQELWEQYCITAEELRAHQEEQGRRQIDEEQIQETVETIRGNFTDLRDELRHEQGVFEPERVRFLRAYAPYYSPGDSLQSQNAVDFTYQGHYLGAVGFRDMILTNRGWGYSLRPRAIGKTSLISSRWASCGDSCILSDLHERGVLPKRCMIPSWGFRAKSDVRG